MVDIADHEAAEIDRVNASERTPVVFVHRLAIRQPRPGYVEE